MGQVQFPRVKCYQGVNVLGRANGSAMFWRVLFLVLGCFQMAAAKGVTLLLIFNSNLADNARLHRGLVQLLKQQRAEGHFAGTGLRSKFLIYNAAEPAHAATLKRMGITKTAQPCISVTELNAKNLPSKVIWRTAYDSPEGALAALDEAMGLNSAGTVAPAGRLSPPGMGFSIDMPYPIVHQKTVNGVTVWVGLQREEGMALVAVASVPTTPANRASTLNSLIQAFLDEAEIKEISRQEIVHQGVPGLEVTGQSEANLAKMRVFADDEGILQIMMTHYRNDETAIQRFFDSLTSP